MAEWSGWWTTDDTGDGAAAGYTQAQLSNIAKVLAACSGFEGVAPGLLNQLACTANGANTVAVNTGGGMVDGKPYHNSASVDVNIPSATGGGNTRIDRIVLRAGWAAQTVRITRIAGTDAASPTAPALTQTSGTTYDISLCTVLVDEAGAVTVTDARTMAGPFWRRQGGSATIWSTLGATAYTVGGFRIQAGVVVTNSSGVATVTFPIAFSYAPIVLVTANDSLSTAAVTPITAAGFVVTMRKHIVTGSYHETAEIAVSWLAIGPA